MDQREEKAKRDSERQKTRKEVAELGEVSCKDLKAASWVSQPTIQSKKEDGPGTQEGEADRGSHGDRPGRRESTGVERELW